MKRRAKTEAWRRGSKNAHRAVHPLIPSDGAGTEGLRKQSSGDSDLRESRTSILAYRWCAGGSPVAGQQVTVGALLRPAPDMPTLLASASSVRFGRLRPTGRAQQVRVADASKTAWGQDVGWEVVTSKQPCITWTVPGYQLA